MPQTDVLGVLSSKGEKQVGINNFKILAKSLVALALLVNPSGSLSQTLSGTNNHNTSSEEHRVTHQKFSATLIMQLVEEGRLNLDEPTSRYSSDFKDDSVKIKHLISHTSDGTLEERY
jgi:beta-lactamase family protein